MTVPALIGAGGAIASALINRRQSKETPIQERQRQLIDDLLESVKGRGSFSDLFSYSERDFEKNFLEPAKDQFRNQIAPQIQQQYIASGQQRSTGLEDTLARAGVNLDNMLNQYRFQQQQQAQNRQLSALERILGQPKGGEEGQGFLSAGLEGLTGYLSSPQFGDNLSNILNRSGQRKGFVEEDISTGAIS